MMKKSICILLAALMLGALVFAAIGAVRADADVGNFNDYGDGGGGDYGGGDYGGGYDYGDGYDSGDGDLAFLFGWLFSSSVGPYAAIPIVLLIVFLVIRSNMKHGRRGHRGPSAHVPPPAVYAVYTDNSGAVEAEVRAAGDEAFSMADFLSAAETVFVKLQYAWTARDWESIRPFESNRLFNKHKAQLEEYIRLGRTDVMERISVNRSYAVSRVVTGEEERIAVYLEAAFNNYIIETESGKVLQGDPETRYEKRYLLTFVRTARRQNRRLGRDRDHPVPALRRERRGHPQRQVRILRQRGVQRGVRLGARRAGRGWTVSPPPDPENTGRDTLYESNAVSRLLPAKAECLFGLSLRADDARRQGRRAAAVEGTDFRTNACAARRTENHAALYARVGGALSQPLSRVGRSRLALSGRAKTAFQYGLS